MQRVAGVGSGISGIDSGERQFPGPGMFVPSVTLLLRRVERERLGVLVLDVLTCVSRDDDLRRALLPHDVVV